MDLGRDMLNGPNALTDAELELVKGGGGRYMPLRLMNIKFVDPAETQQTLPVDFDTVETFLSQVGLVATKNMSHVFEKAEDDGRVTLDMVVHVTLTPVSKALIEKPCGLPLELPSFPESAAATWKRSKKPRPVLALVLPFGGDRFVIDAAIVCPPITSPQIARTAADALLPLVTEQYKALVAKAAHSLARASSDKLHRLQKALEAHGGGGGQEVEVLRLAVQRQMDKVEELRKMEQSVDAGERCRIIFAQAPIAPVRLALESMNELAIELFAPKVTEEDKKGAKKDGPRARSGKDKIAETVQSHVWLAFVAISKPRAESNALWRDVFSLVQGGQASWGATFNLPGVKLDEPNDTPAEARRILLVSPSGFERSSSAVAAIAEAVRVIAVTVVTGLPLAKSDSFGKATRNKGRFYQCSVSIPGPPVDTEKLKRFFTATGYEAQMGHEFVAVKTLAEVGVDYADPGALSDTHILLITFKIKATDTFFLSELFDSWADWGRTIAHVDKLHDDISRMLDALDDAEPAVEQSIAGFTDVDRAIQEMLLAVPANDPRVKVTNALDAFAKLVVTEVIAQYAARRSKGAPAKSSPSSSSASPLAQLSHDFAKVMQRTEDLLAAGNTEAAKEVLENSLLPESPAAKQPPADEPKAAPEAKSMEQHAGPASGDAPKAAEALPTVPAQEAQVPSPPAPVADEVLVDAPGAVEAWPTPGEACATPVQRR